MFTLNFDTFKPRKTADVLHHGWGEYLVIVRDWGDEVEFEVYELTSMFGQHGSIIRHEGRVWGTLQSYFPDEHFAHLQHGSHQRRIEVMAFWDRMEQKEHTILRDMGIA